MDLNNHTSFHIVDTKDYLAEIVQLPDQLENAYRDGLSLELPAWQGIKNVLIAGMGGSAIGADLVAAYASSLCPVPIVVQRNYTLPAWAHGPGTLVIASSHSGNTEETLAAFDEARSNGCRILALCTGGKLARKANESKVPLWTFEHAGQPRAAVGFSFGLLMALLSRLGLIPNPDDDLARTISAMRELHASVQAEVPLVNNSAKRLAAQLVGQLVMVFGSELLEPVARRWKTQINELAKAWGQFEFLPEADHNALAGLAEPKAALSKASALFLRAQACHPRSLLRSELTKQAYANAGIHTQFVDAQGDTPLAQQWTALLMGDYVAYYLAILYEIDPTPIAALEGFKRQLAEK